MSFATTKQRHHTRRHNRKLKPPIQLPQGAVWINQYTKDPVYTYPKLMHAQWWKYAGSALIYAGANVPIINCMNEAIALEVLTGKCNSSLRAS